MQFTGYGLHFYTAGDPVETCPRPRSTAHLSACAYDTFLLCRLVNILLLKYVYSYSHDKYFIYNRKLETSGFCNKFVLALKSLTINDNLATHFI